MLFLFYVIPLSSSSSLFYNIVHRFRISCQIWNWRYKEVLSKVCQWNFKGAFTSLISSYLISSEQNWTELNTVRSFRLKFSSGKMSWDGISNLNHPKAPSDPFHGNWWRLAEELGCSYLHIQLIEWLRFHVTHETSHWRTFLPSVKPTTLWTRLSVPGSLVSSQPRVELPQKHALNIWWSLDVWL